MAFSTSEVQALAHFSIVALQRLEGLQHLLKLPSADTLHRIALSVGIILLDRGLVPLPCGVGLSDVWQTADAGTVAEGLLQETQYPHTEIKLKAHLFCLTALNPEHRHWQILHERWREEPDPMVLRKLAQGVAKHFNAAATAVSWDWLVLQAPLLEARVLVQQQVLHGAVAPFREGLEDTVLATAFSSLSDTALRTAWTSSQQWPTCGGSRIAYNLALKVHDFRWMLVAALDAALADKAVLSLLKLAHRNPEQLEFAANWFMERFPMSLPALLALCAQDTVLANKFLPVNAQDTQEALLASKFPILKTQYRESIACLWEEGSDRRSIAVASCAFGFPEARGYLQQAFEEERHPDLAFLLAGAHSREDKGHATELYLESLRLGLEDTHKRRLAGEWLVAMGHLEQAQLSCDSVSRAVACLVSGVGVSSTLEELEDALQLSGISSVGKRFFSGTESRYDVLSELQVLMSRSKHSVLGHLICLVLLRCVSLVLGVVEVAIGAKKLINEWQWPLRTEPLRVPQAEVSFWALQSFCEEWESTSEVPACLREWPESLALEGRRLQANGQLEAAVESYQRGLCASRSVGGYSAFMECSSALLLLGRHVACGVSPPELLSERCLLANTIRLRLKGRNSPVTIPDGACAVDVCTSRLDGSVWCILACGKLFVTVSVDDAWRAFTTTLAQVQASTHEAKLQPSVEPQDWARRRLALDTRLSVVIDQVAKEMGVWQGLLAAPDSSDVEIAEALLLNARVDQDQFACTVAAVAASRRNQWARDLLHGVFCEWAPSKRSRTRFSKDMMTEFLRLCRGTSSTSCVQLLVGDNAQQFPWENLPVLRGTPVTRVFGVVAPSEFHRVRDGFFVLNPSGDLERTETTFAPILHDLGWTGITRQPPSPEDFVQALREHELFLYCGHSGGQQYVSVDQIESANINAASLLLGCSSAGLKVESGGSYGLVVAYALGGCPVLVGNLWDVTDLDIDRFGVALIQDIVEKNKNIPLAVSAARAHCRCRSIVGFAPVCYSAVH